MKYGEFYSELGKLLYAIAKADGRVGAKEYETLKQIVKEELVPLEDSIDQFGSDNAFYAEMEFDFLEEHCVDKELAFVSFLNFADKNKSAVSPELWQLVKNISSRIAGSENGISKQEQEYLDRLNQKLAQI